MPPSEADHGAKFLRRLRERHDIDLADAVREFPTGATPTATTAAEHLGCPQRQIVTSIVCDVDGDVVLALVDGDSRVDTERLAAVHGGTHATLAAPETVETATGYPVGGVPPFAHDRQLPTYMDESLLEEPVVYPAAGTAARMFAIAPAELARLAGATVVDLIE
ncbi:MAG: aminoacyl-tRNA deacylase [Halobacteriaceae archaeon]